MLDKRKLGLDSFKTSAVNATPKTTAPAKLSPKLGKAVANISNTPIPPIAIWECASLNCDQVG